MNPFCATFVETLGPTYVKESTEENIFRMLREAESPVTPGLLGSTYFSKWELRNCLTGLHGQFNEKEKNNKVTLVAI